MTIHSPLSVETLPTRGESPTLHIEGLTVRYGSMTALDDASLDVTPGQLHGLIGPNGAGKTTLIDAVTGFAQPTGGTVRLGDQGLDRMPNHARARAGLGRSFQHLELFADLTVGEHLQAAAVACGHGDRDTLDALIEWADLGAVIDREASELPHGIQRWVGVCRALAGVPSVLILDEPAAGLDSDETALLGDRLRQIVDRGISILLVEHDISLVARVCDHLTVLDFGRVLAMGAPEETLKNPAVRTAYLGEA